ncbi:hypothetical protein [Peribacillus frigoritolerans]|uniref:hypothetical protein n=1 Tax=Peribacillus frigoritolerans TaxID=450367 RepID=UPI0032E37254
MSVDDFYEEEEHEGIEYKIDKDGTANVSPNQMTLDDMEHEESEVQDESDNKEDDNDDPFALVNLSDDDSLE